MWVQIKEAGNAPKDGVMVCGDSGNDVELFAVPGVRGCMVVNAHDELKDWCNAHASPQIFQVRWPLAGFVPTYWSANTARILLHENPLSGSEQRPFLFLALARPFVFYFLF